MSDQNLITKEAITDLSLDLSVPRSAIEDHSSQTYQDVHGEWTEVIADVFDNSAVKTGLRRVAVRVAGVTYHLVADVREDGPPKNIQIVQDTTFIQFGTNVTYKKVSMDKDEDFGDNVPGGNLLVQISVTGESPIAYQWQAYSGTVLGWQDLDGTQFFAENGWRITYTGQTSNVLIISDGHPGSNNSTKSSFIRCRATNVASTINTRQVELSIKDKTGCWICSSVWRSQIERGLPPTGSENNEHFVKLVKYFAVHDKEIARFYLQDSEELVKRMRAKNYDFFQLVGFNDSIIRLVRNEEMHAAMVLYRQTFFDLVEKYWSDCQHPTWLKCRHLGA